MALIDSLISIQVSADHTGWLLLVLVTFPLQGLGGSGGGQGTTV